MLRLFSPSFSLLLTLPVGALLPAEQAPVYPGTLIQGFPGAALRRPGPDPPRVGASPDPVSVLAQRPPTFLKLLIPLCF